jgi:hypothetical protein
MANDDTARGLTPEEIADRRRLAAELMRPGSLADPPPNVLAQRDQQLMARLLLDPRPMASTADLNVPVAPMTSGPSSAPYAPDSVGRLVFDATPMWPPTLTGDAPSYGEALKEERARTKAAGEKNPVAAPIGGLATGLGLAKAGLTLANRAKDAALPIKAGLSATEGAAYGAAHKAGHVDSGKAEDYLKAVKQGGVVGATAGALQRFAGGAIGAQYERLGARSDPKLDNLPRPLRERIELIQFLLGNRARRAQTRDFIEANPGLANTMIVAADARKSR